MFQRLKFFATVSTVLLMFSAANAQREDSNTSVFQRPHAADVEEMDPHVGIIAGVANGEGDLGAGFEYGVEAGFSPVVPFRYSLELSSATADVETGPFTDDLARTKLLAKVAYTFGGGIPVLRDTYVGAGIGPMLESFQGDDDIALGIMPTVGVDIPIQDLVRRTMTAGVNARYLISSTGNPDAVSFNGMLKYWF